MTSPLDCFGPIAYGAKEHVGACWRGWCLQHHMLYGSDESGI
eukprot:CAMPEP_0119424378 /NCGR_PEP_ID=MMETSP1335-20130426/32414_1 /TAXON_ID=259385 /ORGANISM="Chrysoculter rhomboideus, Strain RCC1486" /LENGTH=41 /DNA_ID= /DNA_START= /DNA_END= /DNA_ORIENTATION=